MQQLHLRFKPDVTSPEMRAAITKVFAEYGRIGGLNHRITDKVRRVSRELMRTLHARRKMAKQLGLKVAGVEHVYLTRHDPIVKELATLKAKRRRRLTQSKRKKVAATEQGEGRKT